MIRALFISTLEGVIKRLNATSPRGELSDREMFQHYGFTSRPLQGAEAIVLRDGNIFISVAEDDRRYRLAVQPGEVALYSDEGDAIHLKRGRVVQITAGTKVILSAPLAELSGNLKVSGDIEAGGDVKDADGTMAAMRAVYNTHTQAVTEGTAAAPTAQM